jgi:hypothetical protein
VQPRFAFSEATPKRSSRRACFARIAELPRFRTIRSRQPFGTKPLRGHEATLAETPTPVMKRQFVG